MGIVEKIESIGRFETIKDEWNELLRSSDSDCLFLTWEWLFTWWKHLAEDRQLHIITVRNEQRLVALAPLVVRPRQLARLLPFPALEFLGMGSVGSDYLDVMIRPGATRDALSALTDNLIEHKLTLELSQTGRTASRAIELGLELRRRGWRLARTTTNVCPYIDLTGHSWDSYLASLGAAHRYNVGRRMRNLERRFDVRFEQALSETQRREALQLLVSLHRKRWNGRGGSNAFHTPALVAFHDELSRLALDRGWLRLYVLRLNQKPVAALYGFRYDGVFYFYQSGFDTDYHRYSVGLVTMGLAIQQAIEEGARRYDLLRGDESYKYLWAHAERELMRLEIYPPRVRGLLYQQVARLRWHIKNATWRYFPAAFGEWTVPRRRSYRSAKALTDPYAAQVD